MRPRAGLREPDATAEGYEGRKLWSVTWGEDRPALIAAPTAEAAMVAAARFWGVRWQRPEYHMSVQIVPV